MHPLTLLNFFALLMQIFCAIFVMIRKPRSSLHLLAAGVFGSFAIWSLGFLVVQSPDVSLEVARIAQFVAAVGWTSFSGFLLFFNLEFTGDRRSRGWRLGLLLTVPPAIFLTMQSFGLLITEFDLQSWGWRTNWTRTGTDSLFFAYYSVCAFVSILALVRFIRREHDQNRRRQGQILLWTALISLGCGTFTNVVAGKLEIPGVPPIAHVFALIWGAGVFYAVYKYKLFVLDPATAADNILEVMSEALFLVDPTGRVVAVNRAARNLTGLVKSELPQMRFEELFRPDETEAKVIEQLMAQEELRGREGKIITKGGALIPVSCSGGLLREEGGKVAGLVFVIMDITDRLRAEESLRQMTVVDELTGLYNRRGFFTLTEQQMRLADRNGKGLFLLFMDIDRFKTVNDTLGHREGDWMLIETAKVLVRTFRKSDVIARMGGDEFVVAAIEADQGSGDRLQERLQVEIDLHNRSSERKLPMSLSVGIAYYTPKSKTSLDDILKQADERMYDQKQRKLI